MANRYFIDSGFWINIALKDEPYHKQGIQKLQSLLKTNALLMTSNDVIDETVTRLLYVSGIQVAKQFYTLFRENTQQKLLIQLWVDETIQQEAWRLLIKYREHTLSLTDCTSIALMQQFNIAAIATFDSDFTKVGIQTVPHSK